MHSGDVRQQICAIEPWQPGHGRGWVIFLGPSTQFMDLMWLVLIGRTLGFIVHNLPNYVVEGLLN